VIEVSGLTVSFGPDRARALDGVSFTVQRGDRIAVLGSSGAGKTTLLRALLGAVVLEAGSVRISGREPHGSRREARMIRRATGMIRQGNDLVRGLTARTNIAMGATADWRLTDWFRIARGCAPRALSDRMIQLAEMHVIAERLDDRVDHLSGGQRQRVAVCRALIGDPDLLLADEPTTGLDPVSAAAVEEVLLEDLGTTTIVSTHDLVLARRFPRVIALRDGRVVHDGGAVGPGLVAEIYAQGAL